MNKYNHLLKSFALVISLVIILAGCGSADSNLDQFPAKDDVTVIMTVPVNNATGITVNSELSATFSSNMNADTINTLSFTLFSGSEQVGGTVECVGSTATFTPLADMAFNTLFTATITNAVRDTDGNEMAADKIWSFTTGTESDLTPPAVLSTIPSGSAVGVAAGNTVSATFSEAVASATVISPATTFTLEETSGAVPVAGSVSLEGLTATFTPASDLIAGTGYTARISTSLEDISGNPLAADYSWTFTTAGMRPVMLGSAGDFVMLASTGITDGASTTIHGAIGLNAPAVNFSGFDQVLDISETFSRAASAFITGNMYASDYAEPTPTYLDDAIADMSAAFTDVDGRDGGTALSAEIGGLTLAPGLYHTGAAATITTTLTLDGGPDDIYIFQINGALTMAASIEVVLSNGALPENICWQTDGALTLGASAIFPGIVLSNAAITLGASAVVNGRLFAATINTIAGSDSILEPAP